METEKHPEGEPAPEPSGERVRRTETRRERVEGEQVLDSLATQLAVLDEHGRIVWVNEAWERFSRENGDPELRGTGVGQNYFEATRPAAEAGDFAATRAIRGLQAVLSGRQPMARLEYPCDSPSEKRWFLLTATRLEGGGGAVVQHLEITDRKSQEDRLAFRALHDPLTSLMNRTLFFDLLRSGLARARRRDGRLAVLFLDLDGFKAVNDTYGHQVGDELLVQAARRLERAVREGDIVARVGGDEFAGLLDEIDDPEVARTIAERIADSLRAPFRLEEQRVQIGVSVGLALSDGPDAPEELLRRADEAMYAVKREGGGVRVAGAA